VVVALHRVLYYVRAEGYYAERDAYNDALEFNRAMAESADSGGAILDAARRAGYPDEQFDYRYGGVVPQGYGQLVDGLGYYP